jgi:hypothetical protein
MWAIARASVLTPETPGFTNGTCGSGAVPCFEVAVDMARQLHLERELNRCLRDSLE